MPRRGECVLFPRRVLLLAALCIAALALPASAAGWRADQAGAARSAGYAAAGGFETLWLSCAGLPPGRLAIRFSGFPAGLPLDSAYTVVVSADNLAFIQEVRPVARTGGGYDLGRTTSRAELQPLIDSLKRGSKVEVSAPAGRRTLPLSGSGKALAALEAGCAP